MPRVNTLARTKPKTQKKPGEIFKRLMAYIFKNYKIHCIAVVVLILLSSLANIVGTMFMKKLIDDYIIPLLNSAEKDFNPLLKTLLLLYIT